MGNPTRVCRRARWYDAAPAFVRMEPSGQRFAHRINLGRDFSLFTSLQSWLEQVPLASSGNEVDDVADQLGASFTPLQNDLAPVIGFQL